MMNSEDEQWHWQEPETAWKGVGIYHITMVVSSRKPLLGELVITDNDPQQARVEWSDLGKQVLWHRSSAGLLVGGAKRQPPACLDWLALHRWRTVWSCDGVHRQAVSPLA